MEFTASLVVNISSVRDHNKKILAVKAGITIDQACLPCFDPVNSIKLTRKLNKISQNFLK